MKKFKPVILTSIICAIIFSLVSFWVPPVDWPFLPYLILAGFFMVLVQKENVSYKFLDKLLLGSLLFGLLITVFIFLRMYVVSRLVYDAPLPLQELRDEEMFILAGVYSFLGFLGGLIGITLKGAYFLYKEKLDWIIIIAGSLFATISSLAVFKIEIGGTIMSAYHGFPYPYFTHQIKDVVDGFYIGKWIFLPGSLCHYIIFNYLLYLVIFVLFIYLIKFINKNLKQKYLNTTFILFGLLVFMATLYVSFMSVKKSYINHQISKSKYCEKQSDCTIIGNISPFSCAIVTNKNSADRILKLVKSYPSTGELQCGGNEKAACIQNKCRVSIDYTSKETYWDMLKKAVEDCRVESIMQAHNSEVTAILKDGMVINAVEPEIDDIFDIIDQYKDKCGEIKMMTE